MVKQVQIPNSFKKEEGAGLLGNFYQEADAVNDSLEQRRQRIAKKRLGIQPETEYSEPDLTPGKSSL